MRWGAFLLGGLVGATAAVVLTGKRRPMLFSAVTNSDVVGSFLNQVMDRSGKKEKVLTDAAEPNGDYGKSAADVATSVAGLGKVQELINQDSGLKAAVDDILAGNGEKSQIRAH
ncbi:hypothetical protein [Paenibacillus ehimensis]|uniref:YtxH domain-containing protein n=1 Tax=Paenibacillus ehimensis TaxID=79264 RepID=A0ABT8VDZ9_9BACL|nr:hypothetical protein [Paenibacillus ehimensis]MDO3679207.1 hypothetical protein [Paenibacillus ehimensis]MEC0212200.1 hypothetical protein [Paenibacillus ehimensis]